MQNSGMIERKKRTPCTHFLALSSPLSLPHTSQLPCVVHRFTNTIHSYMMIKKGKNTFMFISPPSFETVIASIIFILPSHQDRLTILSLSNMALRASPLRVPFPDPDWALFCLFFIPITFLLNLHHSGSEKTMWWKKILIRWQKMGRN